MGREQKRKQAKKDKHKIKNVELKPVASASSILKIIASIAIILLILYYVLAVFVTKEIDVSGNKDTTNNKTTNNSESISNKILAINTFNQVEEIYYVYYYNFSDEDENISSAINNLTDYKIYKVDTNSSLNKNYISNNESGNTKAKSIEELKVINPTLIKIENDTIVDYYEGKNNIINYLSK